MKKWRVILSLCALMMLRSSACASVSVLPEIVVRVGPTMRTDQLQSVCAAMHLAVVRRLAFTDREYLVEVSGRDAAAVFKAAETLGKIGWIEWAVPNRAYRPQLRAPVSSQSDDIADALHALVDPNALPAVPEPNDAFFPNQWHLHNTGQYGGTPGADINAREAWEITRGDPNIVIAILDTGVDSNHPDLINNLVPGYDFVDRDDRPDPSQQLPFPNANDAHGTLMAGVAAAEGNNGIGVVGVAPKSKIMPIKILSGRRGLIGEDDLADALRWAARHGADVLSNSWGLPFASTILHSAVKDVTEPGGIGREGKGCVVVWAVASRGRRIPSTWQEAYEEVIAVGAVDQNDTRWYFSDYGPELDIMAPSGEPEGERAIWTTDILGYPGVSVFNEDPNLLDYTDKAWDTSICAPMVAGVAALILSEDPNLSNEDVRRYLLHSARDLGEPGRDDYYAWGRVDARAALDMMRAERADVNQDYGVDFRDFALLAQSWPGKESLRDLVLLSDCWLNEFGLIDDVRIYNRALDQQEIDAVSQ